MAVASTSELANAVSRKRAGGPEPGRSPASGSSRPSPLVTPMDVNLPSGEQCGESVRPAPRERSLQKQPLPTGRMIDCQLSGMEGNTQRKRQPGSVPPVADDGATAEGELEAELVLPPSEGLEFYERNLTAAPHDPRSGNRFSSRLILRVASIVVPANGPCPPPAYHPEPEHPRIGREEIAPFPPLLQGGRKPFLGDRDILLDDRATAELLGEICGRSTRLSKHDDPGHRRIDPADDADKRPCSPGKRIEARFPARGIGRRNPRRLDANEEVVILVKDHQATGNTRHGITTPSADYSRK